MAVDLLADETEGRDLLAEEEPAGNSVAANLRAIEQRQASESFEEPSTFDYLFNRIKKGFAGFMGLPGNIVEGMRPTPDRMRARANNPDIVMTDFERQDTLRRADEKAATPASTSYLGRVLDHPMATSADYGEVMGVDPGMRTHSDLKRYAGGVAEMVGSGGPFALATKPATMLPLATSIVGSGIGMEAGGDVASGLGLSREVGEAGGALVGGLASAVAPNALLAGGNMVKNRFSPAANKARAESAAGREIAGQLESYPPAGANIQRSLEISDQIPGFTPSLPARSGAPGLLAEERVLVSQNPKTLNRAVENIEHNRRAVAAFVNEKFPQIGGETAAQRIDRLRVMSEQRLAAIRTEIDEKLDDAVRVFQSNPSNYENGQRLRDLLFKQKQAYAGTRSQKYQAVYDEADRVGVRVKIDDEIAYAESVLKNELNTYQQSEIPQVFRQLTKDLKKEPPPTGRSIPPDLMAEAEKAAQKKPADISFRELHSLYKRANADLASLRGSSRPDKDFQVMLLEGLKTKLTEKIKGFEADGFGEVATKLKEANRFYAEEYVPRFKQGFGADVAARYSSGEFRTPDQLVTELITKRPNNTQAAKDFKLLFDEVPEAWQALRGGYLDELYRNGGTINAEGRINQKALDTFLRKHEPTLKEFPEIKKELSQLALDNGALLERRAYITKAEKELAAHDLYKLFQGKEPAVVLSEATTNPNAMRALAFTARNDPRMAKGLARGIADHVTQQADPAAFLAANEEAIRAGLRPMGEEHFKNLKTAVEALTINSRSKIQTSVQAGSVAPDNVAEKLGSSPRAIISHILNVQRGRTGAGQEGAAFLGRWFDKLRRDHRSVAMEAVFYDKDAARAMANLVKNPESRQANFDFVTQMTSLGVRAEVAGQE